MAEPGNTVDLEADHVGLTDTYAVRRYFRKFETIIGHMGRVADEMRAEGSLSRSDVEVLTVYVRALSATFGALGHKYLLTGRDPGQVFGSLSMDRVESGFPVFRELLVMANDAQQAGVHLSGMPTVAELKEQMIHEILSEQQIPTKLQFALSQRLYYQALYDGGLFWATNDPVAHWIGDLGEDRRRFMVHWAVYDSQINLPTVYLMEVEDTGSWALPKDTRRWPEAQRHLIAQSVAGLKLLTIAQGFDRDFDDLHPKRLRRFHLGPMYSSAYTLQTGPLREVLEDAGSEEGQDWALAWTVETLESERVEQEKSGWFGKVERQIFALDPFSGRGVDTGATRTERAIILPARPYQVLAERNPPGFREVRKFVVSPKGRVLSYR
ncbi:hypothetical protein [Frigidibacter sp. ROC022]|uniref:hypothetical protein n=1 Tax=Frigidibacter sp. ROC022 TaxID=2971796 RepID=UPI00215A895C|nr:hypothetical protein [Frigidibacter sp. ROC022]MCR8724177.1 hypothetical protein [Frigidibacter sp. ROC022]